MTVLYLMLSWRYLLIVLHSSCIMWISNLAVFSYVENGSRPWHTVHTWSNAPTNQLHTAKYLFSLPSIRVVNQGSSICISKHWILVEDLAFSKLSNGKQIFFGMPYGGEVLPLKSLVHISIGWFHCLMDMCSIIGMVLIDPRKSRLKEISRKMNWQFRPVWLCVYSWKRKMFKAVE